MRRFSVCSCLAFTLLHALVFIMNVSHAFVGRPIRYSGSTDCVRLSAELPVAKILIGRTTCETTSNEAESASLSAVQSSAATSHIFCNRELNMDQIQAVGFDMDYTLAQYQQEFDLLAYNGAKQKLVDWLGYPNQVKDFKYQHAITRRGCMIDKKRGNILKLDQHRYVRNVEHGLTQLSREERKAVYRASYQETETFAGKEFVNIDTPFSLVDACLFAQLVDLKDSLPANSKSTSHEAPHDHEAEYSKSNLRNEQRTRAKIMRAKTYAELWVDMRRCIDRCHRDGVIKLTVAEDPAKYIVYDEKLFPMLRAMRRAGRKVFLLTNSLFDYTQVVMNFLEGQKTAPQDIDFRWMDYFDLIIVGGNKPAFLLDENSLSIYKVNPATGALQNCEVTPRTPDEVPAFLAQHGKVFQGGNAQLLHTLLQVPSGDDLLYVGDHIFADILRSKRSLGWRTCLIVPELQSEVEVFQQMGAAREELMGLKRKQYLLENELDAMYNQQQEALRGAVPSHQKTLTSVAGSPGSTTQEAPISGEYAEEWARREAELAQLRSEIRAKLAEYDSAFHPRWGQLFKAGFQESRISKQIKDYACIYTSKASNLGGLSPVRPLRPIRDMMAHDHHLAGL